VRSLKSVKQDRDQSRFFSFTSGQHRLHCGADLSRANGNRSACCFKRGDLFLGSTTSAGDNCARVTHPSSLRCRLPGDVAYDGFSQMLLDVLGGLFFGAAPNLADQHDCFGRRIIVK